MTEFINMLKNYANFSARTTRKGFWMATLFMFLCSMVCSLIDVLIGSGTISTTATSVSVNGGIITIIFAIAIIVPGIAIEVRRLRDAGLPWQNLFYVLIPIAGIIILIVKFCKPSVADDGVPVV